MTPRIAGTSRRRREGRGSVASMALSLLGLLLTAVTAQADQAVCIGINHYKFIPGSDLAGCINDANLMQGVFTKYHFQSTLLTDGQATKQGILQAIRDIGAKMKPGERFAFYFAGHGTPGSDKNSNLLPSDADAGSEEHDITAQELYQAVSAVPASSRTVILDSCFSGGLTRALHIGQPDFRSRVFLRLGHTRDLVLVNSQDTNAKISGSGSSKICYLTASRENEQSGEDSFNGQHDGVFTHYFAQQMSSGNGPQTWSAVETKVNGQVNDYTRDQQHPTLSPNYGDAPVFSGAPVTNAAFTLGTIKTSSLWNAYNADHANPFSLLLTMTPNRTTMHVNEQLSFETHIGSDGYLLLLEHGVSGNVNLLFPASGNADDAEVKFGQVIAIPPNPSQKYAPDQPGTERVKAMLFSSKAAAAALLATIPSGHSLPYSQMRSLPPAAPVTGKFVTSDITFEVVPTH